MPQNWNPSAPHSTGLEFPDQGISARRIAGLQQQMLRFISLAAEPVTAAKIPLGLTTANAPLILPPNPRARFLLPDYAGPNRTGTAALNSIDGYVCADLYPSNTFPEAGATAAPIFVDDYPVSAVGGLMNGYTIDRRWAGGPSFTSVVNTATPAMVAEAGDSLYWNIPNITGFLGSAGIYFGSGAFPLNRHVLGIEFLIVSSGPLMATILRTDPVTGEWRSSPSRLFWDSAEFQDNLYKVGEAFVDNRIGASEINRLTPQMVRDFNTNGTRRLLLASSNASQKYPHKGAVMDHISMRVYSTTEQRVATGWVGKNGKVTLRVPSDARPDTDLAAGPAPFSKTLNQELTMVVRQFAPGNTAVPSLVIDPQRVNGEAQFRKAALNPVAAWSTYDTVSDPQTFRPARIPVPEPVTGSLTMYRSLTDDSLVTAETQPYGATGGIWPYYSGGSLDTGPGKNFVVGAADGRHIMYVLVSDSLAPNHNIEFQVKVPPSDPPAPGLAPTVRLTLTPDDIAKFPVVAYSTVSGENPVGSPDKWELETTTLRWRRVRLEFPRPLAFESIESRFSVWAVPTEGFTKNYLIGAMFPQSRGGYAPLLQMTAPAGYVSTGVPGGYVNAASGDSLGTSSWADLQLIIPSTPPTPTGTTAVVVSDILTNQPSSSPIISHPRLSWAWSPMTGLNAKRFDIERYDEITETYQRVGQYSSTAVKEFDDFEARLNLPSTYRVRAVRTDDIEGPWSQAAPVTPTMPCGHLAFTANSKIALNSVYVDAYTGDTSQSFTYRDSDSVAFRQIYGRDYEVAFRTAQTGGATFTRNVLIPSSAAGATPSWKPLTLPTNATGSLEYFLAPDGFVRFRGQVTHVGATYAPVTVTLPVEAYPDNTPQYFDWTGVGTDMNLLVNGNIMNFGASNFGFAGKIWTAEEIDRIGWGASPPPAATYIGDRPRQNVDKHLLTISRANVPYVCVRDGDGGRWYSNVTETSLVTTRRLGCDNPVALASLNIVEIASVPHIAVDAAGGSPDTFKTNYVEVY